LPDLVAELDDDEELPTPAAAAPDFEVIPAATPAQLAGADASIAAFIAQEQRDQEARIKKFGNTRAAEGEAGTPEDYVEARKRGN